MKVDLAAICLMLFFLLVLPLAKVFRFLPRTPLSVRCFLGGWAGVVAWGLLLFGQYWVGRPAAWVLYGLFMVSPICFSIGARRVPRDATRHKARALRWMNIVGLSIWVCLILIAALLEDCQRRYDSLVAGVMVVAVVFGLSTAVLVWPSPNFPWTKLLPHFPAVLVMPAVLGWWAVQFIDPGQDFRSNFGFPLPAREPPYWYELKYFNIQIDITLALLAAYIVAMVVDRLLFPWIRNKQRGSGESS